MKRIIRRRAAKNPWPYPHPIGSDILTEHRQYYIPVDDPPGSGRFYYYHSMSYADTRDNMKGTIAAIAALGLSPEVTFEFSMSPASCVTFRVPTTNQDQRLILPLSPRDVCPIGIPRCSFEKVSLWRMSIRDIMPYLNTEWEKVKSTARPRRVRHTQR